MEIVVVIIVLGGLAVLIFKRLEFFVFYIAIVDIFLRIVSFIGDNIPVINEFLSKIFPSSIGNIIRTYSSGIFETVLLWLLVVVYSIFLFYSIRKFIKKK